MIRLDTNYIIRYLINDDAKMSEIAENIILNNITYISNEVFAEVIYVLIGVYNIPKKDICEMLIQLISFENIQVENKSALIDTIKIFKDKSLDFVDCLLCIYSKEDEIKTFDKKLLKCIDTYKK
ncbi:pilus assembly protein [Arcobacter sp. FW59]|nr:pilus assembly protein [Arcobacter sp. FW59]